MSESHLPKHNRLGGCASVQIFSVHLLLACPGMSLQEKQSSIFNQQPADTGFAVQELVIETTIVPRRGFDQENQSPQSQAYYIWLAGDVLQSYLRFGGFMHLNP